MTICIIGGDSQIGAALAERLRAGGASVITTTRRAAASADQRYLDLADDVSGWQPPSGVTCAYLLAAISTQAACLANPALAERVNVTHTVALARQFVAQGAFVVFSSTNLVFDGAQPNIPADAPYSPRSLYGQHKAAAEQQLRALGEQVAVVRLAKVFPRGMGLLHQWRAALQRGEVIRPFYDLVVAPVPLDFTAHMLAEVGQRRLSGIVQLSGLTEVSYAELAYRLAEQVGAARALVQPISAASVTPPLEYIPLHTTLDNRRIIAATGITPPDIATVLASVFS